MRLNKQILHLAIPNIISNLSVPLLSGVDTALVGHLPQTYFIGAVAVGSMIFNFIYWGFGFLRMGTTGLTAQAFGAGKRKEIITILGRGLIVALSGSLLIIVLQKPLAQLSFHLIHASNEVEHYARNYYFIRIFAAPATLALYAFQGWFLGMQNARYPLVLTVVTNLLNVGFDFLFVYGLGMNSDGVALGTVLAQYIGLVLAVWLFCRRYRSYLGDMDRKRLFDVARFRRFLSINSDIFLRTLLLVFAFSFFTAKSAEFGDGVLAANSVLMQLWLIFSYAIDGFAFSGESLVGKFWGGRDYSNLRRVIRYLFYWGSGLGLFFSLVYFLFPRPLIYVFTNQQAVVNIALSYMGWTMIAPVLNSFCYIWDGIYLGATATKAMRNTSILALFVFFLPAYYIMRPIWGNNGMWLAMTFFMIFRGLSLWILSRKYIWRPMNE